MITIDITPDGGETYRVTAKARHIVQWERLGKGRSLGRLNESTIRLTDVCEIAHVVAVRDGKFSGSFDAFLDSHDVAAVAPDQAAADADTDGGDGEGPTQPAP